MDKIDLLKRYAELTAQIEDAKHQLEFIEGLLELEVQETGSQLSAYGLVARMKPGRKTINHEAAVQETLKDYDEHDMHSSWLVVMNAIDKHSTHKTTVKWAEVTKAAKIDTSAFVTEAAPTFVVEAVQS